MIEWVKNKLMRLAISTASIEQNLHLESDFISTESAVHSDVNEGSMFKALLKGELTREVEMIRAQLYAITEASNDLSLNIVGYEKSVDEEGNQIMVPVFKPVKKNHVASLRRIKTDNLDNEHNLRYVIINDDYGLDSYEGSINHDDKSNFKVEFTYEEYPKFQLDEFLQKINIREIDEEKSILELYFHKYNNGYDIKSKVFHSNLISLFEKGNKLDSLINFKEVGFVTSKSDKGVKPLYGFLYHSPEYLRQLEFNGSIVVKFIVKNSMVEFPITDKYKNEELEKLYESNAKRSKEGF